MANEASRSSGDEHPHGNSPSLCPVIDKRFLCDEDSSFPGFPLKSALNVSLSFIFYYPNFCLRNLDIVVILFFDIVSFVHSNQNQFKSGVVLISCKGFKAGEWSATSEKLKIDVPSRYEHFVCMMPVICVLCALLFMVRDVTPIRDRPLLINISGYKHSVSFQFSDEM